jgi:predicted nucleic acid-binding protein
MLAEYQETTEELRIEYPNRPFVPWADVLAESAELVFPSIRVPGATPDPFDEMVLECALSGEVDLIVSGDKKHLLLLRKFRDIPIISPTELMRRIQSA